MGEHDYVSVTEGSHHKNVCDRSEKVGELVLDKLFLDKEDSCNSSYRHSEEYD